VGTGEAVGKYHDKRTGVGDQSLMASGGMGSGRANEFPACGFDPRVIASDPVLRELHLTSFSTREDFERFAATAAHHPPAARILREMLRETNAPQTMMTSLFEPVNLNGKLSESLALSGD
jgi:hypothetical protein